MGSPSPINSPPSGGAYYQLNRRQQVFVDQLALNGGNVIEAYRSAGYIAKDENESAAAWHLMARQDIRKAFLEIVRGKAVAHAEFAINILKDIAGDPKATMSTRVKAAQSLAEIIGVNAPPEPQQVDVNVRLSRQEYEKLAVTLLGKLTPDDLQTIEVEYKEIRSGHPQRARASDSPVQAGRGDPGGDTGAGEPGQGDGGSGPPVIPEANHGLLPGPVEQCGPEAECGADADVRPAGEVEPGRQLDDQRPQAGG
jgi:phage terminase small subunit